MTSLSAQMNAAPPDQAALAGSRKPWLVALAGMVALAVAMGIGRFAFTPLLPMMLHDGVLTLAEGSWLATTNYFGYLVGAFIGMALPWIAPRLYAVWHPGQIAKTGLVLTVLLTAAMAWAAPAWWPTLRFASGVVTAITFLGVSSWCMVRLASLGRAEIAGVIFAGPGAGILITGLMASGMVAGHWHSVSGWWTFAALAVVMSAFVWLVIQGRAAPAAANAGAPSAAAVASANANANAPVAARAVHALAYGLSGFGYIITATFLPVIARAVMPGNTLWADLFWPIAGGGAMVGAVLSTRLPARWSRRKLLIVGYLMQASGVALSLLVPNTLGFAIGSLLVGVPFTAITFFALQEARRIWPASADSFVGLITGLYGIGQIAGPALVAWMLVHAPAGKGFERGLECAALSLIVGVALYLFSLWRWPQRD